MTGQFRVLRMIGPAARLSVLFSEFISLGLLGASVRADVFYLGTQAGHHVAEISAAGAVSVFADLTAGAVYSSGVAFAANGDLYASDPIKNTITKITPSGTASLFKTLPSLPLATGMAFDGSGNLYVGNTGAHQINKITPAGALSLFATLPAGSSCEGLAFDVSGNLYAAGTSDQVNRITPSGTVSLFATLPAGSSPFGLAFDAIGNLYVSGFLTDQISKISPGGAVSLFATLPTNTQPVGLAFDAIGNLYEADVLGEVHKITSAGVVSLFVSDANESFLHIAVTDDTGHPLPLPQATLLGDYNRNGIVDAADYVVWRQGLGTTFNQEDYNVWRAHFGRTAGSGAGAAVNAAIPEPATLLLIILAVGCCLLRRVPYKKSHQLINV
jgi:hypothetical protein